MRRTALRPGSRLTSRTELSPGQPIGRKKAEPGTRTANRSKGLRPRSKKTERVYAQQRRPLVADLLDRFPICQIQWDGGCQQLSVDVHELLSRGRGGSITDEGNCITGCRHCHDAVTRNPAEAEARGFLLKSGRPSKAVPR